MNNSTFPACFTRKEGQIYINTWHGILKLMGYDMPNGNICSKY
ncbi:MAG: CDP-glycerol glycerophosphotransferase family protein [Eubacterium sp.]